MIKELISYAYILECADGSYYTGWTNDIDKRLQAHNCGKGGKYTRGRLPVRVVYQENFAKKEEAQSREWHIKRLSHEQKKTLIEGKALFDNKAIIAKGGNNVKTKNSQKGDIHMTEKKVMLTEDGYNKLVAKLNHLKSVRRIEVAERLKAAIALGDLSENSEYDDAKNEQAFLEGEIQDLEVKIRNFDIIKESDGKTVTMGSRVVVRDVEFDEQDTFMIVGSTEADPDEGKISNESPLGIALLDKEIGDIVDVNAPAGVIQYEIVDIKKK